MKKFIHFESGQLLVELLVTIGLAAILFPALLTGFVASRGGRAQADQRLQAIQLLQETQEAVRVVREKDWTTFAVNGTYYPDVSVPTWILKSGPEPPRSDGFTRSVTIADTFRDNNTKLIVVSGTPNSFMDPSTKKVTTTVSWGSPLPSQVSSTIYLTRYISNDFFTDTSFNNFTKTGSVLTSTVANSPSNNNTSADGQVVLAQAGGADWCGPGNPIARLNLTGNGETRAVVAGVDRAFVSSGGNNAGRDFWNVTVNNSVFPPVPAEAGTYDQNGVKANQVFGESHFAYLATDKNSSEVIILDVTSNNPVPLLNLDLPGNTNGKSIFVSNDYLFVTTGDHKLYRYLLASDRKSTTQKGSFNLSANGNAVYVSNSYVFIAMDSSSTQLQIIDANNPNTLQAAGSLSMGNNAAGQNLFVSANGNRAYFVTRRSSTQSEFFIINTQSKSSPVKIGSGYDTGAMDPQGITVIDNRAIIVGLGRPQYQVVKVDNDSYTQCAVVPKTGDPDIDDIYNVSSVYANGHAYSYIVTANSNFEFQIIEGGLGGAGGYTSSGTYQSAPFPSTPNPALVAFNRATVTSNKPSSVTDIKFQVAVADAVGGNCSAAIFTFVGPNGPGDSFSTSSTYGTDTTLNFPIPFPQTGWPASYTNPGKCFQYKATLSTSDTSQTPKLLDVTINYSP